jgi:hypothetical protein
LQGIEILLKGGYGVSVGAVWVCLLLCANSGWIYVGCSVVGFSKGVLNIFEVVQVREGRDVRLVAEIRTRHDNADLRSDKRTREG